MTTKEESHRHTISELLQRRASRNTKDIAFSFPELGQHYAWSRVWEETSGIARGFMASGIVKGDRVAVLIQGQMELILSMFAAACIGAIIVPLNSYSKKEELRVLLKDSRPAAMVVGLEGHGLHYAQLMRELVEEEKSSEEEHISGWMPSSIFVLGDGEESASPLMPYSELARRGKSVRDEEFEERCRTVRTEDPLILLYTSGTSGRPKGVLRTTSSFLVRSGGNYNKGEATLVEALTDRVARRFSLLNLLPLYHLGGFATLFTALKVCNIRIVMLNYFNPIHALTVLAGERCQIMSGTPFMIRQMLSSPRRAEFDLSSLLGISFTSAPMNSSLLRKVSSDPGLRLVFFMVSYGSSEAGAVANGICFLNRRKNPLWSLLYILLKSTSFLSGMVDPRELERNGFSFGGKIDQGVEIKIVEQGTSQELPYGGHGEIAIRSHRVMRYLNSEETRGRYTEDGFYLSGDLGFTDERRNLMITGRLNRVISRGGEKISPGEVEHVLAQQQGVEDAFVLGLPDELYGEQVYACVVPSAAAMLSEEGLRSAIAPYLSAFKIPRHIVIVPALPMSATGKIAVSDVRLLLRNRIEDIKNA
ncbi:class I adenylate-forming enzyme family protein [Paenibacillus sp. sgz500958]|uniref:class I adenylate-forming enzyme family protein n=1 Tax=Paenibacillus sp. sgz500958 TaxID=3242475 RepID=UPI0036D218E3